MSGTVIRDAVIRLAIETSSSLKGAFDGGTAAKSLDGIKNKAKETQNAIDELVSGLGAINTNPVLRGLQQGIATGGPHAGAPVAANSLLGKAATGGLSSTALVGGGVAAGLTISLTALSAALQQMTQNALKFDQMLVRMAESSASLAYGLGSARASGAMGVISANHDLSHYKTMGDREGNRRSREMLIQTIQANMSHRPLAEQESVRTRIEAFGNLSDQGEEHLEHMAHLNSQIKATRDARTKAQFDLGEAQKAHESAERQREKQKEGMRPTIGGYLAHGAAMVGTLGIGNPALANPIARTFGGITPAMAELGQAEMAVSSGAAGIKAKEQEKTLQDEIRRGQETELQLEKQKADEAEKRLGTLRETTAVLRQNAEATAEHQKLTERSFGMMSPVQQARLRRIAKKAKAGGKLNHRELQMLGSSGLDEESIARQQAEEIANKPENAEHFKEGRGRVADARRAFNQAESQQTQEQTGLIKQIQQYSQNMQQSNESLGVTAKEIATLAASLATLAAALDNLKQSLELVKDKQRGWIGG